MLLEEFGRALVPGSVRADGAASRSAPAVGRRRSQRRAYYRSSHKGELIGTMAWLEPSATSQPAAIETAATPRRELHPAWHQTLRPLCPRRRLPADRGPHGTGATPADGITLFLIDAKSPGLTITKLEDDRR